MLKPELIARQSAHPSGLLGHVVARVMAVDTAAANRWVRAALSGKPGERILELGCGPGRSLRCLARSIGSGELLGVDPSHVMCSLARRHNRSFIESGQVRIACGDAEAIPAPDACFDRAYSVHTIYFWPDLEAGLRELRRVLRPGGQLLLGFHSSENFELAQTLPESVYTLRSGDEILAALRRSGFPDVQIRIDPVSQLRLTIASR